MKNITLEPLPIEFKDSDVVRRCKIKRNDDGVELKERDIWFQFPKSVKFPQDSDCDAYLIAVLMDAMHEGRQIIVKGSVSEKLLANLMEYQGAWNKWLPDVYTIVDISVETVRKSEIPIPKAVCAFSGGVDATFSVWRHTQRKLKYGSQDIAVCAFVRGFDIPLQDEDAFERAFQRSQKTLQDINIDLLPIATNYRRVIKTNWEHCHACALVAALNNFKQIAGNCILGSSEPYNDLVIPWGSSPITDCLLSSGDFTVIHDGAAYSRTEKVGEIVDWQIGTNSLRVCWQGEIKDKNCGVCEKCVRTKLNFLAIDRPIPSCFPPTQDLNQDIKNIRLRNEIARVYLQEIVATATSNQINEPWVKVADKVARKRPLTAILFPEGSSHRKLAKSLQGKIRSVLGDRKN